MRAERGRRENNSSVNLEGPIGQDRISRSGLIGRELINRKTIENRREVSEEEEEEVVRFEGHRVFRDPWRRNYPSVRRNKRSEGSLGGFPKERSILRRQNSTPCTKRWSI